MRTPAGKECKYFYGNYFRGKNVEECRLIGHRPPPGHWTPDLCSNCPLPDILWANSCSNIVLTGQAIRKFPFIKRKVVVTAFCTFSQSNVDEPQIGCGKCHTLPDAFQDNQ